MSSSKKVTGSVHNHLENRYCSHVNFFNATFYQSMGDGWSLNVSAISHLRRRRDQAIFATLSYALDENTTLNVGGNAQRDANQGTLQAIRSLPRGPGYGYNLYAANGQDKTYLASVSGQNDEVTLTAGVARQTNVTAGQLQAQGSVALLNGDLHLARSLGDSFAIVEVPDYPDVSVYYQNQYMGKTNSTGSLLIPEILPYQDNIMRVEVKDLPLDATISNPEVNAIPYYRSGLVLSFPIKSSAGALMQLILPSGENVPTGTVVTYAGEQFIVGYKGEAYVTGLVAENRLTVNYKNETYFCDVPFTRTENPLPHLGKIQCQKKQP
jgi:outer membrane usher protein